jgi:aspartate kinase
MKVFKFGGASVKDAAAVKNLAKIVRIYNEPLVIIVSAMGKTTNAMEELLHHYFKQDGIMMDSFKKVRSFHNSIVSELFPINSDVFQKLEEVYNTLEEKLNEEPTMTYNFEYDQIVSLGEILSTIIVASYLNENGIACQWLDIRKILKTNDLYREAKVDFKESENLVQGNINENKTYVTQGFIASNTNNITTTLGREGSDYSAALLGFFLNAESVTVWKDVPGVLNADPKWFDNTEKIEEVSYTDAIELAFYGVGVIHPRTIQPLKRKSIPLKVKSFLDPEESGTVIGNFDYQKLIPCFIFKMDQVLIDIYPPDLSFIAEENLQNIFKIFASNNLRVNLMQNTAVRFRICVNNDALLISKVVNELSAKFDVITTECLELITIRYYDEKTIERVMVNKEMILEQRSIDTIQLLVRDLG